MSSDIGRYEHPILSEILTSGFYPKFICVEINVSIPPQILFTVIYNWEHYWVGDYYFDVNLGGSSAVVGWLGCAPYGVGITRMHSFYEKAK